MFKTKQIVFSAMAIAIATVLSTVVKLPSLPQGGSITLFSMLVICLIGYWYGPVTGITAAVAYGIIQLIVGPYIVHPLQVILDFPLAFGALGLSGFFSKKKYGLIIGYLVGVSGRFFFAMISGLIFYTTYVEGLQGNLAAIWASTLYNLSYLVPEAIATLVILPPMYKMFEHLKKMALQD